MTKMFTWLTNIVFSDLLPGRRKFRKLRVFTFGYFKCVLTASERSVKAGDEAAGKDRSLVATRAEMLRANLFCKWHH